MPTRLKVPCQHPGCPNLVPAGEKYCSLHKSEHAHDRLLAGERGYNARWRRARKAYLQHHPLCVKCLEEGKYVQATVVDHIVPHRGDPVLFWDENNWQALCKKHHDQKTGRYDSRPEYSF